MITRQKVRESLTAQVVDKETFTIRTSLDVDDDVKEVTVKTMTTVPVPTSNIPTELMGKQLTEKELNMYGLEYKVQSYYRLETKSEDGKTIFEIGQTDSFEEAINRCCNLLYATVNEVNAKKDAINSAYSEALQYMTDNGIPF